MSDDDIYLYRGTINYQQGIINWQRLTTIGAWLSKYIDGFT